MVDDSSSDNGFVVSYPPAAWSKRSNNEFEEIEACSVSVPDTNTEADEIGPALSASINVNETPKTNGLLHAVIVSQTQNDTYRKLVALLEELLAWRDMVNRFGNADEGYRIKVAYMHVIQTQHVGWKWGALGDAMSYVYTGSRNATNYDSVKTVNNKHVRQVGQPCFGGDPLIAALASGDVTPLMDDAILTRMTRVEADQLYEMCCYRWGLVQNPVLKSKEDRDAYINGVLGEDPHVAHDAEEVGFVTIDDRDSINVGSFWEWCAQMESAPAWVQGSTPALVARNPNTTLIASFGSRAEKLFQSIAIANTWIQDRQQSCGKTWFHVASFFKHIHMTELLSPYRHTSHDHLESKAINMIKLPSVKCSDTRIEHIDEAKDQLQRFLYGDCMAWINIVYDNSWFVRGWRWITGQNQGLFATRSYAEYVLLQNPTDFVWSDVDFLCYLAIQAFGPLYGVLRRASWLPVYIPYAIVGWFLIVVPLYFAPMVYAVRIGRIRKQSYSRIAMDILRVIYDATITLVQSSFFVLPGLIFKPIMFLKVWFIWFFPELLSGKVTGWTKKAPGYWSEWVVLIAGCLFGFSGTEALGYVNVGISLSIPWLLWPIFTRPVFLIEKPLYLYVYRFFTSEKK